MTLDAVDGHRRVQAPQRLHGISRVSVGEHDRIGRRQPPQIVTAFHQPLRLLTVRRAVFRDRLIEAHQRSAAAMAKQDNLGDPGLAANEFDRCFHIQRRFLPAHLAFIVLKSRVEAKCEKAAAR